MTNRTVCLILAFLCCANVSFARQSPKECSKGPEYWCTNLRQAADCGAVHHCIATVWETQTIETRQNEISNKFIKLFRELKDARDIIDEDYPSIRLDSACLDIRAPAISNLCRKNAVGIGKPYIKELLMSEVSAETMCRVIGMCNSDKIDKLLAMPKKKPKTRKPVQETGLLGSEQCTWGPSYWCSNISTSHQCRATPHCVQRVWAHMSVPHDSDDICKICTDMVQQARDQLESNETQSDLKAVFEGSCKLIYIKVVVKECMKLADEFVPDLVETLASQMNPQVVCSVAGLCNNANIDDMLEEYQAESQLRAGCTSCHKTVGVLRKRFDATGYEDFLVSLLQMCTKMDSLSDSCSMLVFKYYENIVAAVKHDLTPNSVCHASGQCAFQFHRHDEFIFPEENEVADDVPCEFCEQLVKHLRDTLIANTTEVEFHKVLIGLCKQTGQFKEECLHLVDEYYSVIYNMLTRDLNGTYVCTMIGICGRREEVPLAPLLPREIAVKAITNSPLIGTDEANSYRPNKVIRVPLENTQTLVRAVNASSTVAPLPLERMFVSLPRGQAECSFCQYFLHYLQVELSDVTNEEKIKYSVEKACDKLPESVKTQCTQFVEAYGPAVIALLVQEIDPASVCPALGLCPQTQQVRRVDVNAGKSNCPLCLFAVEQLITVLANNKTETNIRHALENLCLHLSTKLRSECTDFVDTYTRQLVETLLADMNAQEVCVFLKLCKDEVADPLAIASPSIDTYYQQPHLRGDRNNRRKPMLPQRMLENNDIETNEIPDNTVNGRLVASSVAPLPAPEQSTRCVMCEYLMSELEHEILNMNNTQQIIAAVHSVCNHLPKTVRAECNSFVDKYGDKIIALLIQIQDPKKVCTELGMCNDDDLNAEPVLINVTPRKPASSQSKVCVVCEFIMTELDEQIKDKNNRDEIENVVRNVCNHLPQTVRTECTSFMTKYADLVIDMLAQQLDPKKVCEELKLCQPQQAHIVAIKNAKSEILDCALCETVVMAVKKVLSNDRVDRNIVHIVEKSCALLPAKYSARCHTMMEIYGDSVIHLIEQYGTAAVCQKIGLCSDHSAAYVQLNYERTRV